MLKITLITIVLLAIGNLYLLIKGLIIAIKAGGGNVLLPGLGLIVSLPAFLILLLLIEIGLITLAVLLSRGSQSLS